MIGKWYQGIGPGFHPNERGFDYFCGMLEGSHSYFPTEGKNTIERNGQPVASFSSSYLTDFFTDEGIGWMTRQQEAQKPWFVFMSYNAPHTPMHATMEDLAHFSHILDERRRTYAAMMWAMDRDVGRIREWLSDNGELENTLIVFFSDNGGPTQNASWNGALSDGKGTLKEGGVRVPMMWSWPGALPAGARYPAPVSALDALPSFLAAANAEALPLREPMTHEDPRNFARGTERYGAYDGINVLPYLRGEKQPHDRTLFWRLQGQAAIRHGDLKLVRLSHRPAEVFRPDKDPGELLDLASDH